jgi:uncharacterized protein with von Willebrand factor type A (vWA) domain
MSLLPARVAALVVASALLAGGCGDGAGTGPSSDVPASVEMAYSNLDTREAAHHRASLEATDRNVLRAETGRYAVDMDSLMDDMMDSCFATMSSGDMMGDHDMRRMGDLTGWMGDMIGRHRTRVDSLFTFEEMRAECVEHHEEMVDLLDEMRDALRHRGMMSGGMMGGGMR